MIRILSLDNSVDIASEMREFGVDKYGIQIMKDKGVMFLIKLPALSSIAANILKQEMLSIGADAAVSRSAIIGSGKATDCLLMGTLAQVNSLILKLRQQPLGLKEIACEIKEKINNYQRQNFQLFCGRHRLNLGRRTLLMGIMNLTPDSFSGDGLYFRSHNILNYTEQLVKDGADIIDIGGESTRPGAKPVAIKEEISRTVPIIKKLAKQIKVPISIDTYKPEVAKQALDAGASIVNDIMGVNLDNKMAGVIRRYKAAIVLMHIKGKPRTMQKSHKYKSLLTEILSSLEKAIMRAEDFGIDREKIIIDPGIGFGKTLRHNLEILKNLKEFRVLGCPVLVGPSRKSFIGKLLNLGPDQRIMGTAATVSLAIANGANIVRVHDVKQMRQVLKICDAILN